MHVRICFKLRTLIKKMQLQKVILVTLQFLRDLILCEALIYIWDFYKRGVITTFTYSKLRAEDRNLLST